MTDQQDYVDQMTRDRVRAGLLTHEEANARRLAAGLPKLPFELREQAFRIRVDLPVEIILKALNGSDASAQAQRYLSRFVTIEPDGKPGLLRLYRKLDPDNDIRTINLTEKGPQP